SQCRLREAPPRGMCGGGDDAPGRVCEPCEEQRACPRGEQTTGPVRVRGGATDDSRGVNPRLARRSGLAPGRARDRQRGRGELRRGGRGRHAGGGLGRVRGLLRALVLAAEELGGELAAAEAEREGEADTQGADEQTEGEQDEVLGDLEVGQ